MTRKNGRRARMARSVRARLRVYGACLGFGTVYGAVFGGWLGAVLCFLVGVAPGDPLLLSLQGAVAGAMMMAIVGAVFGAAGGSVAGALGVSILRPWGWAVGAALASMGLMLVLAGPPRSVVDLIATAGLSLVGGLVGVAVSYGLGTRRSRIPGVQALVNIIQEAAQPLPTPGLPGDSSEVIPSAGPEGRGDEGTPACS